MMAKIWDEPFDQNAHKNHMPEIGGRIDPHGSVIIVEVGKYRLEFLSVDQLVVAIQYFEARTHDTTRMDATGGDHWEFQPWHSRLKAGLQNKTTRPKVLKVLRAAKEKYRAAKGFRAALA